MVVTASQAQLEPAAVLTPPWIFYNDTILAVNANDFYEIVSCFYDIWKDAQATHALFALDGTKNEKKP